MWIVEIIANKLDRKRVAEFLDRYIERGSLTTYKCYLEDVKAYGFDHIILIGNCYAGILFSGLLRSCVRMGKRDECFVVAWRYAAKEIYILWGVEFDGTVTERCVIISFFYPRFTNKLSIK